MAANVACASSVRRPLPNTFAAAVRTPRTARPAPAVLPIPTRSRPGFLTVLLRALSAAAV
jgi:hypothetical protein